MTFIIGTDEAGYGPNLGPLVVAATAWHLPDNLAPEAMYDALRDAVTTQPPRNGSPASRLAIADSKRLHKPGSLADLERGVHAALRVLRQEPATWKTLWESLSPPNAARPAALPWLAATDNGRALAPPWYDGFDRAVPYHADPVEIETLAESLEKTLTAAGVRLLAVRAAAVFPLEFNRRLTECDSKGSLLSATTLTLAADLTETLPDGRFVLLCDKHGGRNRYRALLEDAFPDRLIEIAGETSERSVYRFGPPRRRYEARFQARGESVLPVALASMTAKYLRELAMDAFNVFWSRAVPGLRETAGYPVDAKRFAQETAEARERLGIAPELFWRVK